MTTYKERVKWFSAIYYWGVWTLWPPPNSDLWIYAYNKCGIELNVHSVIFFTQKHPHDEFRMCYWCVFPRARVLFGVYRVARGCLRWGGGACAQTGVCMQVTIRNSHTVRCYCWRRVRGSRFTYSMRSVYITHTWIYYALVLYKVRVCVYKAHSNGSRKHTHSNNSMYR